MEMLYKLGASEVIPEEFETSVEIFTRVLSKYLVPQNQITEFVDRIRTSGYHMFRSLSPETNSFPGIKLHFPDLEVCSFVVEEDSFAAGKTLAELNLRNNYGLTLLAIRNESETNSNPTAQSKLLPKNIIFVLAKHEAVKEASKLFKNQNEEN
jgi:CPA2 family monovalent cation:H+ antiporter-2